MEYESQRKERRRWRWRKKGYATPGKGSAKHSAPMTRLMVGGSGDTGGWEWRLFLSEALTLLKSKV